MALSGSLADMGIIDLIQFPHAAGKTGRLDISLGGASAMLGFKNGALVHATIGNSSGMDALVEIVGLNAGEFEFVADVEPDTKTIELDVHQALMKALKLYDERKMEEEKKKAEQVGDEEAPRDEALQSRLRAFADSNGFTLNVSVVAADGALRAEFSRDSEVQVGVGPLREHIHALMQSYNRPGLTQIIFVDELGTVVVAAIPGGGAVVLVAQKGAPRGGVSMSADRLAGELGS